MISLLLFVRHRSGLSNDINAVAIITLLTAIVSLNEVPVNWFRDLVHLLTQCGKCNTSSPSLLDWDRFRSSLLTKKLLDISKIGYSKKSYTSCFPPWKLSFLNMTIARFLFRQRSTSISSNLLKMLHVRNPRSFLWIRHGIVPVLLQLSLQYERSVISCSSLGCYTAFTFQTSPKKKNIVISRIVSSRYSPIVRLAM